MEAEDSNSSMASAKVAAAAAATPAAKPDEKGKSDQEGAKKEEKVSVQSPRYTQGVADEPLAEAKHFFSPFQPKSRIQMGPTKKLSKACF